MFPYENAEHPITDEDALRLCREMFPGTDLNAMSTQGLARAYYMLNRQNEQPVSEAWENMLRKMIETLTVVIEKHEAR